MNPMEEDNNQEHNNKKHVCKFCSKSFPCGRSLGGHMRSHVINGSGDKDEKLVATTTTTTTRKLSSLDSEAAGTNGSVGYGLRENPKKTWRLNDSSEETMLLDKLCRECGKGFHSWKALFGHMKCHSSEKERVSNNNTNSSLEYDQDSSWTNTSANRKLVLDSQSDNEATAPNRRRRSKRKGTRYMAPAATSSVSEAEQEQEEVAMSLMMLSRDVGPWGGLNSVAESSVNNNKKKLDSELAKVTKPRDKKWEFGNLVSSNLSAKGKSSEILASESANGAKMMTKATVSINGFAKSGKDKKSEVDSESAFQVNGEGLVLSKSASTNNKYNSIKAKFVDSESKSNSLLKNWANKPPEAEFSKSSHHKRGKFECTTCNKIFHSYQALGGHRASHKKIKGCFATRNEGSENSIEFEADQEEIKHMKNSDNNNEYLAEHEVGTAGFDSEAVADTESKKSKGHECPICLKVFQSGQALGGHKRSHLSGGSESSRNCRSQTVVLQETVPEIRDFLDLNLPAATEDESNSHAEPYRPWWVVGGNNHKQEALVGLMSN